MVTRLRWFGAELRRRKVWRVAVAYVMAGAAVIGLASDVVPAVSLPGSAVTAVVVLVLLGLPVALVLGWTYDLTWAGLERTRQPESGPAGSRLIPTELSGRSIVVLPFDNMSPDPADAYFSDGLTDEIIANLSLLKDLRVISRSTAMVLKGTQKDVLTIGRELGVGYVLEGSVRKAGDDLRITAQLVDAGTDTHLWTERHNGTLDDVFEVQERIARLIVDALAVELSPEEDQRIASRPISDPRAYEAYLRARQETWEWTPEALDRARQQMQNGLELVGPNPLFYAGLGYVYFQYVNLGMENEEYIERAAECSRRALELDPGSAEAHLVLGLLNQAFWGDQAESIRHFQRALDRNPDDPHALLWLIVGYTLVGRVEEAEPLVRRVQRVDPLTPVVRYIPVFVDLWRGRFDHPVEELTVWHRLEPDSPVPLFFAAMHLCYAGHPAGALRLLQRHVGRDGSDPFSEGWRLLLAALQGDDGVFPQTRTAQFDKTVRRDPQMSYFMAGVHALAERREDALEWLQNSVDRGFCNYPFMVDHDALLRPLKVDSRFAGVAARAKEQWLRFRTADHLPREPVPYDAPAVEIEHQR